MPTIQRASITAAFLLIVSAVPFAPLQAAATALGPTVCVRAGTVGAAGNGLVYDALGVQNTSGGPAEVVCTLFRDNTSNTNGMQDLEVSVKDPLSGSPGGFVCDALSLDRKGVIKKTVTKTNTAIGDTILDWGSSVNISVSKGFYAVRCTVPHGGWIRTIYYLEP